MRAARVAELLSSEGVQSTLVIREGSDRYLQTTARLCTDFPTDQHDTFIVDTFPRGWQNELTEEFIRSFEKSIFIARYNRQIDLEELRIFDEIWDPSPAEFSEWPEAIPQARSVGWLVRQNSYSLTSTPRKFLFLDPANVASELIPMFKRITREQGYQFEARTDIPAKLEAEKIVIVGAGYNTFYELWNQRRSIRYIPLKRRYDDQMRRVNLAKLGLSTLQEFQSWLRSPESEVEL
jgi:hypothetical protein